MTLPSGPVTPATERPKGTLGPKPTDDARRADIARVRRYATTLLVVAAVVYVVAHLLERQWWWMGFVRATAEASLVGGLADWFAVTALFRQPLGLPIPHTAIVKRQKDRIARILGNFVQNHFLTREVIAQRMRALGLAQRIGEWLADPSNSARVAGQVTQGVATAVEKLPADKWQGGLVDEGVKLVARAVEAALREALDRLREAAEHPGETDGTPSAIAKLLTSVGTHLVADEAARAELEDRLTEMAASLVEEHGAEVASLIEHTVAGWDPDLAAERIELAVGRDLQYIRLNGTLVGGLAGLALYSLSLLF